MSNDLHELIMGQSDADEIRRWVENEVKDKKDPQAIVDDLSRILMEVGEKYEKGELFLSDLMMIGYQASEVANQLKPYVAKDQTRKRGKIVIGTVGGDIHDIGKNTVIMMLQADGWEVIDLGVDVPAEKFVKAVNEEKPDVVGLSALLTSTMKEMKTVIEALEKKGLRKKVKVIVGGRPVTSKIAEEIGADGYAEDSVAAIRVVSEVTSKRRSAT
jgi:5-methyltetrahydrofolate--homocysteine methyltransferase